MDINVPRVGDATLEFTWKAFYSSVAEICSALTQAGTTAERPAKFLWIGRPYFDTTLGFNVRVKTINPTVWVRFDGTAA